ncbi:MAG: hypothetical protein AB7X49_18720 [Geminicoccaceae bacterium]
MSNDKVREAQATVFGGRAGVLVQPDDGVAPMVERLGVLGVV